VAEGDVDVLIVAGKSGKSETQRLRTDAEGRAELTYTLPDPLPGKEGDKGASVQVSVTLRDTAGQKHSPTVTRPLSAKPILIELIPESGALVAGLNNRVYLFTATPDGTPAKAKVSLRVDGVAHELTTNELGVGSFTVTPREKTVSVVVSAVLPSG